MGSGSSNQEKQKEKEKEKEKESIESAKTHKLYQPQSELNCQLTQGFVMRIYFNQVKSSSSFAYLFSVHHCYLIFEFDSRTKVRCEITNFRDGAAVILQIVKPNENLKYCKMEIFRPSWGKNMDDLLDLAEEYYESCKDEGYHAEDNNCYDFAAFMVKSIVGWRESQLVLQWKQHEMNRVPGFLKKKKQ